VKVSVVRIDEVICLSRPVPQESTSTDVSTVQVGSQCGDCTVMGIGIANQWWPDIITTYIATEIYTVISDAGFTVGSSINYPNTTTTLIDSSAFLNSWDVYRGQTFYTLNTIPGGDSS
jgi:hypothetical protein